MPNLPLRTAGLASCILVGSLVTSSVARAAPIKKRAQLQLQAAVLEHISTEVEPDGSDIPTRSSSTTFGLNSRLGVGFGIGFTEHLELHLLNGFSITEQDTEVGDEGESASATRLRFEILPTLRFVAGRPESKARLFVGAGVGVLAETLEDEVSRSSTTAVSLTAIIGLHAFLNDSISLDPALELSSLSLSSTFEDDVSGLDLDSTGSGFRALFTIGLTGWLGGRHAEATQDGPRREPAPEVEPRMVNALETSEVHLDLEGMGLTVSGAPLQNGRTLLVEVTHLAGAAQWRGCEIELGDGTQTVRARAQYRATAAGRALEEYARASVSYGELDRWARSAAPSIALCGKGVVLRGYEQQRIIRGLERFQTLALRAGTFVEETEQQAAPPVPPKVISDPEVFVSMQAGVMRCVPNQASVTLRFRLSGKGILEHLEPDPTRDEGTSLCLAQTIMNTQFVATGEARTLEHTFSMTPDTTEQSGATPTAPRAP